MKKKIVSLLLVAAMGISTLVGCGGGGTTNNSQTGNSQGGNTQSGPEKITLKVWAPDNQQELLKKQTDAFEKANADKWDIEWEISAVGEDSARDQVLNDAEAAADVFMYATDNTAALVNAGVIAKLGGETKEMVTSQMSQAVVDTVTLNGDIWAIPFTHNTWFMYYDKSIMTDEDVKTMEGIVNKETADGVYNFKIDGGGWYMGSWYYGNGLSLYGMDGTQLDKGCDWNNETGVAVTKYLINLMNNKKVSHTIDIVQHISEHKLGVWFDGAWNYGTYKDELGDDLGMAQIPTFNVNGNDVQLRSFYSTKAIAVNATSKHMAASLAFARFLASEEQQIARFEDSAQVPTNTKASQIQAVQDSDVAKVILAEVENATIAQPSTKEFGATYWDPAGAIIGDIVAGKLTLENVQDYLDKLVKNMTGQ